MHNSSLPSPSPVQELPVCQTVNSLRQGLYLVPQRAVPAGQRPQLNKALRITVIPDEDHLQGTTSPNHPSRTVLATPSVESGPDQLGSLCPFSLSFLPPPFLLPSLSLSLPLRPGVGPSGRGL